MNRMNPFPAGFLCNGVHLQLRQLILVGFAGGCFINLIIVEKVQGGFFAGFDVAAHLVGGLIVPVIVQKVQKIKMFLLGVMDLRLILLAGYDNTCILVKNLSHHINDIMVSAVFDYKKMHGGV